jgi:hypothetical protein
MFNYTCLNPIAGVGLDLFSDDYKKVDDIKDADAALVRSAAMHDMELGDKVLAVARAGAGVNNIPLDKCAEKGIVVFNTPGANANGVKEAVIAGQKIVSDSQAQGKKIVEDTSLIINAEVLKAKSQIREKIITQSMAITEQGLKASAETITKKSEAGFLQDLGQVKA